MKISVLFGFAMLLALPTLAEEENKDPRPEMHVLAKEINAIQKYLLSESSFLDPKNESDIKKSLNEMNEHIQNLEVGSFKHDPALKVNLNLLKTHMKDAKDYFSDGNKPFSRFMLQSSLQMCIACHTRGKSDVDFAIPESEAQNASLMERADFLFATRQFEKGKESYEALIKGYPGNKESAFSVRKALLSLATYYARVKEDPNGGKDYFSSLAKRTDFPAFLQKEIQAWAADFSAWMRERKKVPANASESALVNVAKRLLRSDDLSLVDSDRKFHIRRLRATALLHKALEAPGEKSPAKGEALYLLGQLYHRLNHQLFFRFGEMYLKACIMDYKKTKIAKDCYNALEQAVTEGYTGSSGTNIPEDEEVELIQLKRMAF